jgi:threonyl-tRNA synthetase
VSTLQVDFQEPKRFDMEYVGSDNNRHLPYMIHRALFGSIERFFAILLEHYAGAFPAWLSPVQARILPVRNDHQTYAETVAAVLQSIGARVDVVAADEPLGSRVRKAKLEKIPYVLVVGDDDVQANTVGVNSREKERPDRGVPVADFAAALRAEIDTHAPEAAQP